MGLGNLWSEFKAFAFKGNMIELAVAVVIGAAFGQVIKAMVDDIIMPGVSYMTTAAVSAKEAATDAAQHATSAVGLTSKPAETEPTTEPAVVPPAPAVAPAAPPAPPAAAAAPAADPTKAVDFDWKVGRFEVGKFLAALLNFVLIAFAVFITIVKLLGSVMKKMGGTPKPSEPTTRECPECLSLIPLKAKRCPNCTSVVPPAVPA